MKSLQLSALKSAERFVIAELENREASYLPNPTPEDQREISDALETKQIIQRAIVQGEIEPDLRVEMLEALKIARESLRSVSDHATHIINSGNVETAQAWARKILQDSAWSSDVADIIRRAER